MSKNISANIYSYYIFSDFFELFNPSAQLNKKNSHIKFFHRPGGDTSHVPASSL